MIARGFRPVVWVFMIGAAVLVCYMLNLRVAAERAELARLDRRIVATQQSIRALQTEVGTRSRIPQLEEWNEDVLALSAPVSGQYLQGDVSLARFDTRQPALADQSEVRLASAETGAAAPQADRPARAPSATPAPQRAVTTADLRPEIRRVSLAVSDDRAVVPRAAASKPRDTAERTRRETTPVRAVARDERRPAPARNVARDDRRPAPARTVAREDRRPAPVRTASREDPRPAPARTAARAAVAPVRGASGRAIVRERPTRDLRKDDQPQRRRGARD